MSRQFIIAGNWKMNKTPSETLSLLEEIKGILPNSKNKFILCPPFTSLCTAVKATENTIIEIGAQNCHWEEKGAFTGEISAQMLTDIGVKYAIIGHSERRMYFGETDETVNKRIKAVLAGGLTAILCVGEHLEQREKGQTEEVIGTQLKKAFEGISEEAAASIIVAYEPVWAIGTGKTATDEQAEETCKFIRETAKSLYSEAFAENLHILYGGSMNENNAEGLLRQPNIDGGLIGGASLKAKAITDILKISDNI